MNIVIIYEIFNREFENAQLLAHELKDRGHNVDIVSKATCFRLRGRTDVLIVPNCYTTENYQLFRYMTNAKHAVIFNLQYEQVLSKEWEDIGYHNPKGEAKKAITLCWGQNTFQRLLTNGVPKENLRLTGAIHLDFLNEIFSDFYLSKHEIAHEINLDKTKKWVLYISSFTVASDDGIVANGLLNAFRSEKDTIQDFIEVSKRSRTTTLNWIEKLLQDNDDICLLYRLHPSELQDRTLSQLEEKYKGRFVCVDNFTIRQWIRVADTIFTWFSTSIIECFYARKHCHIVRPLSIPTYMDSVVFVGAEEVSDYKALKDAVRSTDGPWLEERFPIRSELIHEYYCNGMDEQLTYTKIANFIEGAAPLREKNRCAIYYLQRIKFLVTHSQPWKSILEILYRKLYSLLHIKLSRISPWKRRYLAILEQRISSEKVTNQELARKNILLQMIVSSKNA